MHKVFNEKILKTIISGIATIFLAIFLLFPIFAHPKVAGKPIMTPERKARMKLESDLEREVHRAISHGTVEDVDQAWENYVMFRGNDRVISIKADLASFYLKNKQYEKAKDLLSYVINPPKGMGSTIRYEGEPLLMWIEAASHVPGSNIDEMIQVWADKNEFKSTNRTEILARAYYLTGQKYQAFGSEDSMRKSISYFEKAASLKSNQSAIWSDLGYSKSFIGDAYGAKQARIKAYQTAPEEKKAEFQRALGLTNRDLGKSSNSNTQNEDSTRFIGSAAELWDDESRREYEAEQKKAKEFALRMYEMAPKSMKKKAQADAMLTDEDIANAKRSGLIK